MTCFRFLQALALALAGATAALPARADAPPPEPATGVVDKTAATADTAMAAAANPHAVAAAVDILKAGGSALDATIAAQMVLNLVEPQSSGIGGGGFLLHHAGESGELSVYDGRETAPAGAEPDMFLQPDGTPAPFLDALPGGESVGVPGLLRMLEAAHRAHGRLPWASLFEPAIALAEDGFAISPRLHKVLSSPWVKHVRLFPEAAAYFLKADGSPKDVGTVLVNRPLAETFRTVAAGGADAFYDSDIAERIARAVRTAPVNPGTMTAEDVRGYEAEASPRLCGDYRGYRVCGMPPPSSGGVTVLSILGTLAAFDIASLAPDSVEAVHLFAEASRLAYADRDHYVADPDFVSVPVSGMLDEGYLRKRAGLIDRGAAMDAAPVGTPPGVEETHALPGRAPNWPSTTHISVVDAEGNAVALTSSIEFAFGSGLMVEGFLLTSLFPRAAARQLVGRKIGWITNDQVITPFYSLK